MASSGFSAWNNEQGSSWFQAVMEASRLPGTIDIWLRQEVNEATFNDVRAAVSLFIMLARTNSYPVGNYEAQLELAVQKSEELIQFAITSDASDSDDLLTWLVNEADVIRHRKLANTETATAELKEWWSEWM